MIFLFKLAYVVYNWIVRSDNVNYNFSERIRELRKKHNLTQEDLALKLNISDKSISKWEMGVARPSLDNLQIMAEIFDMTLDELVNNSSHKNNKIIKKIVLTGGPCAGKTTAMNWIQNYFQKQGYKVLFIPEIATNLIVSGITPLETTTNGDFQGLLFDLQMQYERIFEESVKYLNFDKILIVCDRGLLDNKAYMNKRDFNYVLKTHKLSETQVMDRYDAVFHLVTAAKGAKEYYNLDNPARTESLEDASKLDDQLINAWTGHPHLRIIDNSTNFEEKMKRLLAEISNVLGEPEPYEIERKYLIALPDIPYLESLPNCEKVHIVQTYLKSDLNEEVRIRQRGKDGSYIYSKTRKIQVDGMKRIEIENRLSQEEYVNELINADSSCGQIIKDRYCLSYKNQYFEIDVYPFWPDKAICEIELMNENDNVMLPDFIKVIEDVTDNNEYKNYNIAKLIKFRK